MPSHIPEELQQALTYQGHGLLNQAAQIYQTVLAQDPTCVNALHGLGIILFQQRQPERAVEFLECAAALWPQAAVIHADLGKAYRSLGRLDHAEHSYRRAVQLRPDSGDLSDELGLILLGQGKIALAVAQFRQTLRLDPNRAETHNRLGIAFKHGGDRQQALAHLRWAVQQDPCLAEAHSNLGQFLLALNETQPALFHCGEAVRLCPESAAFHLNFGNVLSTQGQFSQAKAAYAESLRLAPTLALTYNNMGQVLQAEGKLDEAVSWYHRATQHEPASLRFRINLAVALIDLEQFEEAARHCRALLAQDPRCAEAHNALGLLHIAQGRYDEAAHCFRNATVWKADWAEAHANLGRVLKQLGDFDAALASLRTALRFHPKHAPALGQIATTLRDRLPNDERSRLRQLLDDPNLSEAERGELHFGWAHVLDARGDYAGASQHLERANALREAVLRQRGQEYDPTTHAREVAALIDAFSPTYFSLVRGFGLGTEVLVFVLGLPRSGTTLVEQILASHSRAFGAGEPNLVPRSFNALPQLLHRSETPLACLQHLTSSAVTDLARQHLSWLREWSAADRIIDKLPENYLVLGWITTLFPRARLIHCRRDLRDVALSCWSTNFSVVRWATNPQHIVSQFTEYQRIMAHWHMVLPLSIQEVVYEELVADLEGVSRQLVSFCGLEWEPSCLEFYRTRRAVSSASMMQVRQPLYTTSIGRWRHYEPFLKPMFTGLNELLTSNRNPTS